MSHTPGPWQINDRYINNGEKCICEYIVRRESFTTEELCANARLIAAAPELLDELKRVLVVLGDIKSYDLPIVSKYVEAVITKAEGKI